MRPRFSVRSSSLTCVLLGCQPVVDARNGQHSSEVKNEASNGLSNAGRSPLHVVPQIRKQVPRAWVTAALWGDLCSGCLGAKSAFCTRFSTPRITLNVIRDTLSTDRSSH